MKPIYDLKPLHEKATAIRHEIESGLMDDQTMAEIFADMDAALKELTGKQYIVFFFTLAGESQDEIARQLGLNRWEISHMHHQAIRKLYKYGHRNQES